jgi:hypothetical protein
MPCAARTLSYAPELWLCGMEAQAGRVQELAKDADETRAVPSNCYRDCTHVRARRRTQLRFSRALCVNARVGREARDSWSLAFKVALVAKQEANLAQDAGLGRAVSYGAERIKGCRRPVRPRRGARRSHRPLPRRDPQRPRAPARRHRLPDERGTRRRPATTRNTAVNTLFGQFQHRCNQARTGLQNINQ